MTHGQARRRASSLLATAAFVLTLVVSCTSVPGTPQANTDYDLGDGLVWSAPAGISVQPFDNSSQDCDSASGSVSPGDDEIYLDLLAADCEQSTKPPINGDVSTYLQPPPYAQDVSRPGTTPTGDLVVFTQTYSEYTNQRTDFTQTIGIVTLSHADPYAVMMLMVTNPLGQSDQAGIVAVACAIRAADSAAGGGTACSGH